MANRIDLDELMKPKIWTCGNCGGELHILPYKEPLPSKGESERFEIKTINICGNCSFSK